MATLILKDKVIDEIIAILNEVRNVQRLMGEFGIFFSFFSP